MVLLLGLAVIAFFEASMLAFLFVAFCFVFAFLIKGLCVFFTLMVKMIKFIFAIDISIKDKIKKFIDFICAEWIFEFFPNGGTAVFIRTVVVGSEICLLIYVTYYFLSTPPTSFFEMLPKQLFKIVSVYAAVYAAFYARFVSQWTYLSNLYNQIKEAELNINFNLRKKTELLYGWMSGFIEDAENLHMATKDTFAAIILNWINRYPDIKEQYIKYNPKTVLDGNDGEVELNNLINKLQTKNKENSK